MADSGEYSRTYWLCFALAFADERNYAHPTTTISANATAQTRHSDMGVDFGIYCCLGGYSFTYFLPT
jgi:hypothetical protein